MDDSRALPQEFQQALALGWTVLTANQRAARTLHRAFDLSQRAMGRQNWQPPAILAWDTWLESLWRTLLLDGHATDLLLNATQEHTLWRAIIAGDAATSSLRPVDALASTAADAWLLLHAYRGTDRLHRYPGNSDTRVFTRWTAEFERRSTRAQYLTRADLAEHLRSAVAAGQLPIPPGILLVGFDFRTPSQAALLQAFGEAGATVEQPARVAPAASLILAAAPTEYGELAACARWLRKRLTEETGARLGVIVPAIETLRAEIDRVFRQVLAPELEDITAPAGSGPFEFSLGVPLTTTPMVAVAMDVLQWAINALPLERVSAMLLSPYFATDATEHLARAEFDAFDLRQRHLLLQPQVSLGSLFTFASQSKLRPQLSVLLKHLQNLRPLFNQRELTTAVRTHADWATSIHEILEAAGWAVPASLSSVEFQTRRKWEGALDELATLDFDNVRVPFSDALAALKRITSETLFAPESRHAPVQILGPLESAGSEFDAIWFLRADDISWPARPSPNPLLPWQLQRDLAMPGATPELDAAHARHITERIASSAAAVVFSYAKESTEGPQRPSPALRDLALDSRDTVEIVGAEVALPPIAIETVYDDTPIPLPPDDVLPGGAGILQSQAACAFRAFAEKRLYASVPDAVDLGLDPRERGSLVHDVLERFWEQVQTHAALLKMTPIERTSVLSETIDAALGKIAQTVEPGWPTAYFNGERQRLLKLLGQWLNFELGRSPFAVRSREEMLDALIGPLHIKVRVDRVDISLVNGEPAGDIILDYKTGTAKPADWAGDRPDEPQLPLYAVLSKSPNLAGVAFASIRPGKQMNIEGYESRRGVLPKAAKAKADTLEGQVDQWKVVLERLAEAYHAGDVRVSPKQYPSTCRYCQQRLLCRLDLSALEPDANEDFIDESDKSINPTEPSAEVEGV